MTLNSPGPGPWDDRRNSVMGEGETSVRCLFILQPDRWKARFRQRNTEAGLNDKVPSMRQDLSRDLLGSKLPSGNSNRIPQPQLWTTKHGPQESAWKRGWSPTCSLQNSLPASLPSAQAPHPGSRRGGHFDKTWTCCWHRILPAPPSPRRAF